MAKYPEHEKMSAIRERSQAIGEFIDWLRGEKKVQFMLWDEQMTDEVMMDWSARTEAEEV